MKRLLPIVLIVFLTNSSYSVDDKTLDSLSQVILDAKSDTAICNSYLELGELLYMSNPDSALMFWEKGEDIIEENLKANHPQELHNWYRKKLAQVYNNMQAIYYPRGEMDKVIELNQKSLEIFKELGNEKGLASGYNNLGYIYKSQGKIQRALEAYLKSLQIKTKLGDKVGMGNTLSNIGVIYENQGDMEKALEYAHRSLKIFEELGDQRGIGLALNNLGGIYKSQGEWGPALKCFSRTLKIYKELDFKLGIAKALATIAHVHSANEDYDLSVTFHEKSLAISRELGDKKGEALSLNNIAIFMRWKGDNEKAILYFQDALEIFRDMKSKKWASATLSNLSRSFLKLGQREESRRMANEALELATDLGYPVEIRKATEMLYLINKQEGKHEQALVQYELYIQMRDSLNNEETQKATIRQQTKYEFEKAQLLKEQNTKEQARILAEDIERRDNLQYSIVLICLLGIGALVAMLGRLKLSERVAEGLIFFAFLIFFEFILVLADPYIEDWSKGAPGIKLLFNAGIAALIFPLHSLFERKLKNRLSH